eukprot:TRINITY_DN64154_c0_g1_i1.p1 TRINITY_DN64154_c0_g1~~TRINITY_DN64154_c0_g1_i1.p1  ORF type:complete len:313 (+),score=46.40 TRINITY_DN64154_c0_g1_i1:190-1128(+)
MTTISFRSNKSTPTVKSTPTTATGGGGWDEREKAEWSSFKFTQTELEQNAQKVLSSLSSDGTLSKLEDVNKISDHDLVVRFLVQWKGDTETAEQKFREMIKFRSSFVSGEGHSINELSGLGLPSAWNIMRGGGGAGGGAAGAGRGGGGGYSGWCGHDLRGRPVFYDRLSREAIGVCKQKGKDMVLAHVAHLEHLRAHAKAAGADRVTNILDLRDMPVTAVAHVHFVQTLRSIASLTTNFFPEQTATVFIAFAPGPIQKAWTVMLGLIPDRVKSKFVMLPKKDPLEVLKNFIPTSDIPDCLGGEKPMNKLLPL